MALLAVAVNLSSLYLRIIILLKLVFSNSFIDHTDNLCTYSTYLVTEEIVKWIFDIDIPT